MKDARKCKTCHGGGILYLVPMRGMCGDRRQMQAHCPKGCRFNPKAKVDVDEVTLLFMPKWAGGKNPRWLERHLKETGYTR